jgi:hypothetical protein
VYAAVSGDHIPDFDQHLEASPKGGGH